MSIPSWDDKGRSGQAILLFVTVLSIILIGAVGLGADAGQLYVQRQRAQAAADAGAQAGIMTIYNGTANLGTSAFNCDSSHAALSPCRYVALNGYATASDTTTVDFPTSVSGIPNGISFLRVVIQRNVKLTLMNLLNLSSTTIKVTATAAITAVPSAVPIVITHPTLKDALSTNGTVVVQICGGPSRSIEVNSSGTVDTNGKAVSPPEAFRVNSNSTFDLSKAGPNDVSGDCSSGTGADFVSVGPSPNGDLFGWLKFGSTGNYVQPASPTSDPLASLTEPTQPATLRSGPVSSVAQNANLSGTCAIPCPAKDGCDIYQPGHYPGGIQVKGAKQKIGYFNPGLYYIDASDTTGFSNASGGDLEMMPGACTKNDPDTGNGIVVFNAGSGSFSVGSNGQGNLVGSPISSTKYQGILFWEGRSLHGVTHKFGGGGVLSLLGTIYTSKSAATTTDYQTILLQGTPGSTTKIQGEIITNVLNLGGNAAITMNLSPSKLLNQKQIALIQ